MNMNTKYTTIPTTPHLNHNLADLSRSSIQCLMEFPNGNKTIALTPNMKFNPYIFCSSDTDKEEEDKENQQAAYNSSIRLEYVSIFNQIGGNPYLDLL
jgi:hypothetical protein